MALQDVVDDQQRAATRVVQEAAVGLARTFESDEAVDFLRVWIRDLGRLARQHQDDWVISAYAVQIIRQLRGQLPIT